MDFRKTAAASLAPDVPKEKEADRSEDDDADYCYCCDGGVTDIDGALLGFHDGVGVCG